MDSRNADKPRALYLLGERNFDWIYGPQERAGIDELVHIYAPLQTRETILDNPDILREAEVIFSGWETAYMDEAFLNRAPKLKLVLHGAGSVKGFVTDALWDRGIRVCSAYAANAVPVSEYSLSQILFALKGGWYYALRTKQDGHYPPRIETPGAFGSTVGLISIGMIGRRVCELLKPFDVNVIAYDPFVDEETARALGVQLCSLDEVFERSDVVSLHTPLLNETRGMITGAHFERMKQRAVFINTSRGAVVREEEMIEVLRKREDLYAVLDVTYPEPPEPGSPLYRLPNVVLTPHIAGSLYNECRRMGSYMLDELRRYLAGEKLLWEITRERVRYMA
ncbi:hydroxyacid dehydrogenase [Paenibacillus senegalensis]|uniref:hydroxyacid dehydrogenase n=1 Tax=Paenibacillus senegalensis TaxID=1465766 RepID=UPI000289A7C1|nr:hydroxyacid dehydrogenase [Paenibacillus senegalensis]